MPDYNFVKVPIIKDDCLHTVNESDASSRYKISKALQLAPRQHNHHLYNMSGAMQIPHIYYLL